MAQIRKIVPSGQISDFRQAAPDAGGGFRLLAGAMDAAYQHFLPIAISEEQQKADAEWRIYAKQQMGSPGSVHASSKGYAPGVAPPDGEGWLRYSNTGKIRDKPISAELQTAMSFLPEMGIVMEVFSGGQDAKGTPNARRTGATNHDHGNAADVRFYKDGRMLDWANSEDIPIFNEIIRNARAGGATSFGAGPGYMSQGSMHVGLGAPRIWGADLTSGSAPQWLVDAFQGAGGKGENAAPTITASSKTEPVMIRNKEGGLEPRLYAPSSDPIKQAYNAAAGVAYLSEAQLGSMTAFMQMSEEFKLDPDGFRQAAESYVDQMVENAPDLLKADLRGTLGEEMVRRFNGMWAEKHQETERRAINANGALADRVADDLASAIAGGDAKEIAVQRERLSGILAARESLPGLSWTPEQSFNFVRDAEDEAQRRIKAREKEQTSGWKKILTTITDAAKNGFTAAGEEILRDPNVQALLPDEVQEAMAFTMLRDTIPSFLTMAPGQQRAAVESLRPEEVSAPWEIDLYEAAKDAAAANEKAWIEDPIKRAGEVLTDDPPPELPTFDPNNPSAFVESLASRAAYAERLTDQGYTKSPVYVSKAEAEMLGGLFAKEIPPEMKAMAAGLVVQGMGAGAADFFKQINVKDAVVPHVGMLMAAGGDSTVALQAMQGQALLDQGIVPRPTATAVSAGFTADMRKAFQLDISGVPGQLAVPEGLEAAAVAIYAATIPHGADEATQKKLMTQAWQTALGQSTRTDEATTGGVQKIGGNPALLPPDMSGKDLEAAIIMAFGAEPGWMESAGGWLDTVLPLGVLGVKERVGRAFGSGGPIASEMWSEASGGAIPALGGKVLTGSPWEDGEIFLTPAGGTNYKLTIRRKDEIIDVAVQGQPDSVPFIFDAAKLIDLSRRPK